jgi:hypothetical protein
MTDEDFEIIAGTADRQVQQIVRARARLRGIRDDLVANSETPFEQDVIFARHFGNIPSERRTRTIADVTVTSRVLQQTGRGLSDISGGDLLYEVEGEKFVVLQYKRVD